jgi:hypothetical protein
MRQNSGRKKLKSVLIFSFIAPPLIPTDEKMSFLGS